MMQSFATSVGTVEVGIDGERRTISVYRFDEQRRVTAAAIESWDYVNLVELFERQIGVPAPEAVGLADAVRAQLPAGPPAERWSERPREYERLSPLENAGVPLRFVAVLLDAVLVLFPLGIVVGVLSGGAYAIRDDYGNVNAGVAVSGNAAWALLVVGLAYYALSEALTGATLGKRIVKIRVVDEHGAHPTLGAVALRNLLRPVDAVLFYLVGALFALASPLGQRLGDRAAHTVVVRR